MKSAENILIGPKHSIARKEVKIMVITKQKEEAAARALDRQGFILTDEAWHDISRNEYEVAQLCHADGSYSLYKRHRGSGHDTR